MQIADTPYSLYRHQTGFELLEASSDNPIYFVGYFDTPRQLYEYLEEAMDQTEGFETTPPSSPEIYRPVICFRDAFRTFIDSKPFNDLKQLN